MKTTFLAGHFLIISFLMSPTGCQPEYKDNTRVFVEGKIISPGSSSVEVKLSSGNILISEAKPYSDGSFKLGGPGTTGEKELSFGRKITSFISDEPECVLDYDSLSILLPLEKNYFNFNQIILKP